MRFRWWWLAGLVPAVALSFVVLGCGPKPEEDEFIRPRGKGKKGGAAAALKPVPGEYKGTITGQVKWTGAKPNLEEETQKLLAQIKGKQDEAHCEAGNAAQHSYRFGSNGNLGNVFVWIEPEAGHFFKVPEDQLAKVPKKVELGQPNCDFTPHCLVLFPTYRKDGKTLESTGQEFVVKNDDTVSHNTKLQGGSANPLKDNTLAKGATKVLPMQPDKQEVTVQCSIHTYMRGYIRVYDHPYATVSKVFKNANDPKFGTFEIDGVPVGARVRLLAWHEKVGQDVAAFPARTITLGKTNDETIEAKAE